MKSTMHCDGANHCRQLGQRLWLSGVLALGACSGPPAELAFTDIQSPAAPGSIAPHLAPAPGGAAVLSWLEPRDDERHTLRYASLASKNWSGETEIATGNDWFINQADFPSVVPISIDHWAAHWLVRRPGGTYSYDIALSISADSGHSWRAPLTPHLDNTATEHGFVTLFPWQDGIGAVWLDGRNMAADKGGDSQSREAKDGSMSLRYARLDLDGEILDAGEIDGRVCDCCQTDLAVGDGGPVLAYRDRSPAEIRDISVTRFANGSWTEPVTISDDRWQIAGCPVNGPAITARGTQVVVAWYGAPNRQRRVKLAWSRDAGQTFSTPLILDEGGARGRVDVELLADDHAIVSWVARTGKQTGELRVRQVRANGEMGAIQVVAQGTYSRNSGFPQMIRAGERLVLAWPEAGDPSTIRTASAPL